MYGRLPSEPINVPDNNIDKMKNLPDEINLDVLKAMNYDIFEFVPGSHYNSNVILAQINPSYTFGANSILGNNVISKFQIPPGVFNLSKTTFSFRLAIGGAGGVSPGPAVATLFTAMNTFYNPIITGLEFYTAPGVRLFSLTSNVEKLNRLSAIWNVETEGLGLRNFICKSLRPYTYSTVPNTDLIANDAFNPDPYVLAEGALGNLITAQSIDDISCFSFPYLQVANGGAGTDNSNGFLNNTVAGPVYYHYSINLSELLPDSIFNVNKDIWLEKTSYIDITFNNNTQVGETILADTSTTTYNVIGIMPATNQIAIDNMELTIYSQLNEKMNDILKERLMYEGVPIVIPYVTQQILNFSGSILQTPTFKVSTDNAVSNLYKIYYGLLLSDLAIPGIICNFLNIGEQIWKNTLIKMNNTQLRAFIDLTKREDLSEIHKYFPHHAKTSYISKRYAGSYAMVLDTDPCKKEYNGNDLRGVAVLPNNDLLFTFNTTTSGTALSHYFFAVTNRVFYMRGGEFYTVKC